MRELTDEEIKQTELDILLYIDGVAKKHGLRWYLDGGTLIGAVRHKGFIPWDDDVDIQLLREDYLKMLDALRAEEGPYRLLSMYDCKDYYYSFAKVVDTRTVLTEHGMPAINGMGVYVDVFPVDYRPDDPRADKRWGHTLQLFDRYIWRAQLCRAHRRDTNVETAWRRFTGNVFRLLGWHRMLMLSDRIRARNPKGKNTAWKITVPASCYEGDPVPVIFEGHELPAPADYDTYLRCWYGDYMQLPPEDQRQSGHSFTAWWKD